MAMTTKPQTAPPTIVPIVSGVVAIMKRLLLVVIEDPV